MRRVILADCRNGLVVRLGHRWGVVCMGGRVSGNAIIDFWDGGREHVPTWKVVEVLA